MREHDHHERRRRDLLQGLGPEGRAADHVPSRLAAVGGRLGQRRCCSSCGRAIASSPMTAAAMAARRRSATATTWTTTPPTPRPWSSISTCGTPSISATPPAAARSRAMSRRHGEPQGRVAKAVLVSAVPPLMLKTESQPRRHADRGVRRLPRGARGQPRAVLPRRRLRSVLRLQPRRARRSRRA